MIQLSENYSADVDLWLFVNNTAYELGQLGPEFAFLRKPTPIDVDEHCRAEIEMIIDGKSRRWRIELTQPITGENRRFTFRTKSEAHK